jgi:hypothetical protein
VRAVPGRWISAIDLLMQEIAYQVRCVRDNSRFLKEAERIRHYPILDNLATKISGLLLIRRIREKLNFIGRCGSGKIQAESVDVRSSVQERGN